MTTGCDQYICMQIGALVQREFPEFEYDDLEELRMFLNEQLGLDIQKGDPLNVTHRRIEAKITDRAFERARV